MSKQKHLFAAFSKKVGLVVYLFFFFFSPPIIPSLNVIIPQFLLSIILIACFYRQEALAIVKSRVVARFLVLYGIFLAYLITVLFLSYGFQYLLSNSYRFLMIVPVVFGCVLFIACVARKEGYDLLTVFRLALYAVLLQVLIGLLSLLFDPVKEVLVSVMREHTGGIALSSKYHLERRFYGFANDLLDNFGYGMGLAVLLPLLLTAGTRKMAWLATIIPIILVTFMNARTGLVVAAVCIACFVVYSLFSRQKASRVTILSVILMVEVVLLSGPFLLASNQKAYDSFMQDMGSIIALVSGGEVKQSTTGANLLRGGVQLPSNSTQLFFGTGLSVFASQSAVADYQSDIGYINDIWLVGIIGSLLLYTPFVYLLVVLYGRGGVMRPVAVALLLALLLFQIKGPAIKPGFGMIMTLFIVVITSSLAEKWKGGRNYV